ncbi:MAG: hypothetical protein JJU34_15625 [Lunatimonas sp.]|uniref:DUF6508 domain-containing protein n=1 Tax=Lunatimonas sp. TaxID=2060141 RepID=UPI00263A802E|nr:DUF6508 domain-containing protein [Lunatimonas sp.]MCC5938710.1 hypothetical protein [Lunatimonas sp.]
MNMIQETTPLFIPISSFPDHCRQLAGGNLKPLVDIVHELEFKFYKAEKTLGILNFSDTPYEVLGLKGIHVRLLDTVLKLRLVPLFDWQSWKHEAEQFYHDPSKLYLLDIVTLGKILTVLLRSQGIYEPGFLEEKIKDRFVLNLLKAIVHALQKHNSVS